MHHIIEPGEIEEAERVCLNISKHGGGGVILQIQDPKHSSKSQSICVLQWSSRNPDVDLIEILWQNPQFLII